MRAAVLLCLCLSAPAITWAASGTADSGKDAPAPLSGNPATNRTDWWSFKPLAKPAVPQPSGGPWVIQNPIDAFVADQLHQRNLPQAPPADPRTLIRRLYFDLIGLPPTPEEVDAFVHQYKAEKSVSTSSPSSSPNSIEQLIDRLLDSPQYGERWARHWLDVVHFGETHGYDKDKPRLHAWPYRDYVIRAFNQDKPYARFIEEQLAGDALYPDTADGTVALGFIAAGPWDFIGHAEVPESKTDGKIARHLDRDDMVQNTMGAFCSLTVGCAQCHNHKLDPITQEDYYSLQTVFAALDRADKPYFRQPNLQQRYITLKQTEHLLEAQQTSLLAQLDQRSGGKIHAQEQISAPTKRLPEGNTSPSFGYHSAIAAFPDTTKWVQVDLHKTLPLTKVIATPCFDNFNNIGAGFGFPKRFRIEASNDPEFKDSVSTIFSQEDTDSPNPGTNPQTYVITNRSARYVRFTATKLAPRKHDFILALAELEVWDADGHNAALHTTVTALDSIEAKPRWSKANLVDAVVPSPTTITNTATTPNPNRADIIAQYATSEESKLLRTVDSQLSHVREQLAAFPQPELVYAGTVHYGSGSFTGTGPTGGHPRVIHVLKRGDVKNPGPEVGPGAIEALSTLSGLPARFTLPNDAGENQRRVALAHWISSKQNPLTWRSIVNRVWQHHMGRPLVDTPNDFGRMGAHPTHPELLDWLAATFRDDYGGSLKRLHKLILLSHTYQQASELGTDQGPETLHHALANDSENQYLWHQNRRKLDAESVRDATLQVSGQLDLQMGGPSFQDFVMTHPEHSPHYEYQLSDPEDPKNHRRSIYRFIVRSQQQPFMTTLDCADPSMRIDKRNESLSALQALAMLNDSLMVVMAQHFAERVEHEKASSDSNLRDRVQRAFEIALSRPPQPDELDTLTNYASQNGLANTCRVLFNLNEFSFAD